MKSKRLIPIMSVGVLATALAITTISTTRVIKRVAQADFNYSITFTKDTGASVQLQDGGGTYVAFTDDGTIGGDYFCTLPYTAALTFDFDAASKAAGVEKFLSITGVKVVTDVSGYGVYGSTYLNSFNTGEYFEGEKVDGVYTFPYNVNYISVQNWQSMDVHISSLTIYYECGSSSNPDNITALPAPTNVIYNESSQRLSWDNVPGAMMYYYKFEGSSTPIGVDPSSGDRTEAYISSSKIPFTVEVYAKHNNIISESTMLDVGYYRDVDQRLEAEKACLDRQRLWADDPNASNGAYAKDINDNGQGLYFRYYAYEAGNRDVTVTYSTGSVGSYHTLFANGASYRVTYTENTNWFGDSHVTADVTIKDVTFIQGWNELYLMRNGSSSDNPAWGGWAQIDYITVEGTGEKYETSLFDTTSYVYNLEAEMGHWHWANEYQKPNNWGNPFSFGYGLGEINAAGDGVKFDIEIAEAGTYAIRPIQGGNRKLYVSVDGGDYIYYEFGEYKEWNDPTIADASICQVELTAGFHYIDFTRGNDWSTIDKFVFEKVA
jgi:hypothetical protein